LKLAWGVRRHDVPRGNALATEARDLAREHGYKLGQARALRTMAMTIRDSASLPTMFGFAEEAMRLFDEVHDTEGRAASRDFLSSLHEYVGDLTGGLELALDALSIARELGDPVRQGYALSSVGGILARSGEVDASVERLKEALKLFESADDAQGIGTICWRLSKVLNGDGRSEEALFYAKMARDSADVTQDVMANAVGLTVMADIEDNQSHFDEAERLYRAALDVLAPLKTARNVIGADMQISLAKLLIKRDALPEAEAELRDALSRIEGDSVSFVAEASAREALAELYERQERLSESIEQLRKAKELRDQVSKREAKNKLAQVETRAAMEAARREAELQKLRFAELHGQRSGAVDSQTQFGNYQLLERMAAGGMGEVWRARHRMLERDAAIKVIRRDVLASGTDGDALLRRFEREARATSALKSPHTVQVHDFGITEDGTFYYAMELLDGIGLDQLVDRYGPQPAARVVYILSQVCESLSEAHDSQLIHRDIKPANILLCRYGLKRDFAKVLDFGLVKSTSELETRDIEVTGRVVVGTPAFMPPESARESASLDARSDIYALGCVGYWLLSGKLVFEANSPLQMVMAHLQTPAEPPSTRTEVAIPPDLERVVMSCLSKDPGDRPQTAEALSKLLAECSLGAPWSETKGAAWWKSHKPQTLMSAIEPTSGGDVHTLPSAPPPVPETPSGWHIGLTALIVAGMMAGALWLAFA